MNDLLPICPDLVQVIANYLNLEELELLNKYHPEISFRIYFRYNGFDYRTYFEKKSWYSGYGLWYG